MSDALVIRGGTVFAGGEPIAADVVVRAGRIDRVTGATDDGGSVLDATGLLVAPGFIDLQCNGAHGIDLVSEPERVWDLAAELTRHGVTAFLPTIVSCPAGIVDRAIAVLSDPPLAFRGASPLGLHLEGPMLNPARAGAHLRSQLRAPSSGVAVGWSAARHVALVTLAPELPGALDVVRALRAAGVVVAAGHTDATDAEMAAGIDCGITAATHLFNAMPPFHHRAPGAVATILSDGRITAGVIVDGVHVAPAAVAAAWAALGPDRFALVTDAVAALGLPPGPSSIGPIEVIIGDGDVRLADGTLAGSVLSMDQAIRNLVSFTGCTPADAIAAATATPARVLGNTTKGRIAPGCDADLVLLTPALEVVDVIIAGEPVPLPPA